jgi:hypothetical protein
MKVRLASEDDLDAIEMIVSDAVKIMQAEGNTQWDSLYPLRINFAEDIKNSELYVAIDEDNFDKVCGMTALTEEQSIEYKDCGWDITIPAIVMHRMAVNNTCKRKGIASLFFKKQDEISRERGYNLCRVDTFKGNIKMNAAIVKAGYEYSGDVRLLSKPEDMKFCCYQKWLTEG